MNVQIRRTTENDFFATENLTREAFWNLYQPGCDEHLVLHNPRNSKSYIPCLDLVAVHENEIIGHIISTKAMVVDSMNHEHEVLCVGPLCVSPEYQKEGIGSDMIRASIKIAKESGYSGMILFGNPDYYHRFGFINAKEHEISTKDSENFEPFMALELQENGLADVKGKFFEDEVFVTNPDELIEFEKKFPFKEKGKAKIDISQLNEM